MSVRCHDCHERVLSQDAHVIKAANVCGRAWQCMPCHQTELTVLRRANASVRARITALEAIHERWPQ